MKPATLALIGLACLLFGWVLLFVLPGSRFFAWIIMGLGVVLLVIAAAVDFRGLRSSLASGRGRFGLGTTLRTSLVLAVVFLLNAVSISLYHRFDLSGSEQFALTTQTRKVLAELDRPVEVVTLFSSAVPVSTSGYARDLLAEYRAYTDRLTLRTIDPEVDPDEARRYGLDQAGAMLGVVVFVCEDRQRQVLGPQIADQAEHAFTTALLEVTGARRKRVYIATEGQASAAAGYVFAAEGLRDNLFDVDDLDLGQGAAIPADTAALIIAGSRAAPSDAALEVLRVYLRGGGHLLLLVDPSPPQPYRDLVSEWWVEIAEGSVVEPTSHVAPHPGTPLVPRGRNSLQIGDTYFRGATAILPREGRPQDVELAPLVWSSDEAWLETGAGPLEEATLDPGVERRGPFAMAVLIATGATRIAVVGDSDFAADGDFRNVDNATLFLTAVNWLTASEEVIQIDRRPLVTRRLLLNPEQERFLHLTSVGLLPLLLLIVAGAVWLQRRR